ncbi:MAG: DUF2845 domain-containing protein [Deltaproteobacteria bacterium]|nr:DUF2845 domain-containing protein [Deltaproteobacteria bacterium]MBW2385847.1 DUF2845 domain-containing protein [Deltaproteobacteria bacterium]MBW2698019.1 DUF2845 domain-containing protein [Deltaproteobacteria bacterium]
MLQRHKGREPAYARRRRFHFQSLGAHAAFVVLATLLFAQVTVAASLRCNGQLLEVGDSKARLVSACGQPLSRDVVAVVRAYADGEQIRSSYAEEWSYETASVQGYQLLRFEGGRLAGQGMRCGDLLVAAGDTTVTVLQRCGEPLARDAAGLVHESPGPASRAISSESPIERWVYSQGEGTLLKIITLRGGLIEQIEEGQRQ